MRQYFKYICIILLSVLSTACVHEWPHNGGEPRRVHLKVIHHSEWTETTIETSRAVNDDDRAAGDDRAASPEKSVRYHFQVFRSGNNGSRDHETEFIRYDTERPDFETDIELPPGDYTLYAWSDMAHLSTGKSMFFDTGDFSYIGYTEPYNGNNDDRDVFRGQTSIHVGQTLDADYHAEATLEMERPLARYEFISTDLEDFLALETTRALLNTARGTQPSDAPALAPKLHQYRVKMIYTGYMPHVFNNITNKPIDSRTGMSYDASITILNDKEARLGFDHVMVNGHESSVAVGMELYDPDGKLIGSVGTINVPTARSRNTIVRGKFLTSRTSGGVAINPDFDGEYNIEIH